MGSERAPSTVLIGVEVARSPHPPAEQGTTQKQIPLLRHEQRRVAQLDVVVDGAAVMLGNQHPVLRRGPCQLADLVVVAPDPGMS